MIERLSIVPAPEPPSGVLVFPDPRLSSHASEDPHVCNIHEMAYHRPLEQDVIRSSAEANIMRLDRGFKFIFEMSREKELDVTAPSFRMGFQGPTDYLVYTGINEENAQVRILTRIPKSHELAEQIYRATLGGDENVVWPEKVGVISSTNEAIPSQLLYQREHEASLTPMEQKPAVRYLNNDKAKASIAEFTDIHFLGVVK